MPLPYSVEIFRAGTAADNDICEDPGGVFHYPIRRREIIRIVLAVPDVVIKPRVELRVAGIHAHVRVRITWAAFTARGVVAEAIGFGLRAWIRVEYRVFVAAVSEAIHAASVIDV